jgi:transposase InsO family protein
MGISRASLYYVPKQHEKDWVLKVRMEEELQRHPAYGSRRLAQALGVNRKRTKRVMQLFGVRPYRRRGRKYRKTKAQRTFPNLLRETVPSYANHVWATDFTELVFHGKKIYVSTIIDLFTRQLMGVHVGVRKGLPLTVQTLGNALFHHPRPTIFHSDNGSEYNAGAFIRVLEAYGIAISRSKPGCPWENGYQESFYGKFKVDLGDPNRFKTLGELVAEIYRILWEYNHTRIHSARRMPPSVFAEKLATNA